MDIQSYIGNPRITDYSFKLAEYIFITKDIDKMELSNLYNYHLDLSYGKNALYPQSNWQSHRLCLLSAIAVNLNDKTKILFIENLAKEWIKISDCNCCNAKSQDYHYRDSCRYVVYGWWALAKTFLYLQSITKKPYKHYFNDYLLWINQYQSGSIKHIEFFNSKNMPADLSKNEYNKLFDPDYNINFQRVFDKLTS